jgi:hypothetical protein
MRRFNSVEYLIRQNNEAKQVNGDIEVDERILS